MGEKRISLYCGIDPTGDSMHIGYLIPFMILKRFQLAGHHPVIVIGGGLSGCEIALDLYNKGKTPVIVEMKNDLVAMRGVCLANTSYLRDFFALNKVDVRLNTGLVEITDKGVKVKDLKTGKESEIAGDSVIMSVGYIPTPVAKDGVKLVGDCNGIGNLRTVIWRAWDVAMKL